VLKLNPLGEPESEHEADALAFWDGRGAVRLLARDDACGALLIERCRPGTQLWALPEEDALEAVATVFRALRRPAPQRHPFRLLADEAERWAEELPGRWERSDRRLDRSVVDEAVALASELGSTQPELVVCHQDLHGGNVLAAERAPWLAIDAKPLVGEPAFDTASYLRDRRPWLFAQPRPQRIVARRLDALSEALSLDRERMRGWALVHALASGLGNEPREVARCAPLFASRKVSR
jgi:streptomycin 6-kinase